MADADRAYVYPTDRKWSAFLRARPHLTEVNFWTPSGASFKSLERNQRFLFKAKEADGGQLIGGGLFSHFTKATVSMAWRAFGEGNGVASSRELLDAVNHYRRRHGHPDSPDPEIGCVILHGAFFAPDEGRVQPPVDYRAAGATRGRKYSPVDVGWAQVEASFDYLARNAGADVRPDADPDLVSWIGGATMSELRETTRRHRLGQGEFRVRVASNYTNRCAITGNRVTLTLDAAHIKAIEDGGEHRLDNGLLLRTDVHRLFDAGYLGIDTDHRLRVSKRLRDDFGNGQEFYDRNHLELAVLPTRAADQPNREFLEWHMDSRFKSA
ncbi:MAG: HNH endonuclease [Nocardioides sp.]|jgi:putative restriction endonuclease